MPDVVRLARPLKHHSSPCITNNRTTIEFQRPSLNSPVILTREPKVSSDRVCSIDYFRNWSRIRYGIRTKAEGERDRTKALVENITGREKGWEERDETTSGHGGLAALTESLSRRSSRVTSTFLTPTIGRLAATRQAARRSAAHARHHHPNRAYAPLVAVVVRERRDAFQEADWLWAAAKADVWWGGRERKRKAQHTHTHTHGNRLAAQVMTSKGSLTSARQISITATPLALRDMETTLSLSLCLFKFRKKRRETGGVVEKIGRGRFWNWGKNGTKLIYWSRLRKNFLSRRISGQIFVVFW